MIDACRERPRCPAAEKGDELTPPHVPPSVRGLHPTTPLLEMPRCASQHLGPPDFRNGSGLCENSSARRARRNISKKLRIMESNRAPRTMFDTLLENCIFYILQLYEFSHRAGSNSALGPCRLQCPDYPKADDRQTGIRSAKL